MVLNF